MSGEVLELADRKVQLSIARLAEAFSMSRATVSKRLSLAGVIPAGKRNGYPVYPLKEAAEALLEPGVFDPDGNPDPRTLPPERRNAHYQAELRRVDYEMQIGMLIPVGEHEAAVVDLVKTLIQFLETLPDQLERDTGMVPEAVEAMHTAIDQHRQTLYERITHDASVEELDEVSTSNTRENI